MDQVCKLVGGCSFVLNTGDNFYECGVQPNDYSRFQSDWIQVYQTPFTPTIRSLPWFNVFGAPTFPLRCCGVTRPVLRCNSASGLTGSAALRAHGTVVPAQGADVMLRGCR